jgi:hypothetical protein
VDAVGGSKACKKNVSPCLLAGAPHVYNNFVVLVSIRLVRRCSINSVRLLPSKLYEGFYHLAAHAPACQACTKGLTFHTPSINRHVL